MTPRPRDTPPRGETEDPEGVLGEPGDVVSGDDTVAVRRRAEGAVRETLEVEGRERVGSVGGARVPVDVDDDYRRSVRRAVRRGGEDDREDHLDPRGLARRTPGPQVRQRGR